jgi:hypothetical protein
VASAAGNPTEHQIPAVGAGVHAIDSNVAQEDGLVGAIAGDVDDIQILVKKETVIGGPGEKVDGAFLRESRIRKTGGSTGGGKKIEATESFLLDGGQGLAIGRESEGFITVRILGDRKESGRRIRDEADLHADVAGVFALKEAEKAAAIGEPENIVEDFVFEGSNGFELAGINIKGADGAEVVAELKNDASNLAGAGEPGEM